MNIKREARVKIALVIALVAAAFLLTASALLFANESFSSRGAQPGLDYFKGNWVVKMKEDARHSFNWSVREDLQGSWMTGVVELEGRRVSTDFWRNTKGKIERFAFTADGTFVRLEGAGWDANRLVLRGVASDKTGETGIRETITRVSETEFHALWERQDREGKWLTFADETCTRAKP
jgi:hypothetical protein